MISEKKKNIVFEIAFNGILAAVYVALTLALTPISFGPIQFRLSEILVLFCFFNKKYTFGLTLGCLIANIFSPNGILDIPFGTTATLIACIGIMFSKSLALACIFPVVVNAFIIAGELYLIGEPYWMSVLTVGGGELVVMIVGYILIMIVRGNTFYNAIQANQNRDFVL